MSCMFRYLDGPLQRFRTAITSLVVRDGGDSVVGRAGKRHPKLGAASFSSAGSAGSQEVETHIPDGNGSKPPYDFPLSINA